MKIDFITAGAAGMLCGSCIRDNTLAAELIRTGHDVLLIPTYTPTLTDEVNVSQRRVFFGGISVYLERYFGLFRHTPWLLDRLWDSPVLLRLLSRVAISNDARLLGDLTVSVLEGEPGPHRKEFDKLVSWMATHRRPDVVTLPNSLMISLAAPIKRALGVPVLCTLQGEELFIDSLQEPYRSRALGLIRAAVPEVDGFIAVSEFCARYMADYLSIPESKIHIVPLGINLEGYGTGHEQPNRKSGQPFTVGYFARVTPEKGLDRLAEAYRVLRQERGLPALRLLAAGYLDPAHRGYLTEIERKMKQWGLGGEFEYRGVLSREEKIRYLGELNVLSVPGDYAEPKGLYLLEAMACGVPFVQPRHGVFPEVAEKTGGGLLVEPRSIPALVDGIYSIWNDAGKAAELSRHGREGVERHYTSAHMAERAVEVYKKVATRT